MASEPHPRPEASAADAGLPERRAKAWVGKSLKIQGHIVSDDNLTIDGDVEGTIVVGDHTLTVGPGATVKADLTARTISVSGTVIGKVRAHELLVLGATASVIGEIVAARLRMADGAIVEGPVDAAGVRSATAPAPASR
jgi:cytoskeletal protein CcmA (bactofilin family)